MNLIDPSGNLFLLYHGLITYNAARSSGMGVGASIGLAWNTMAVDFGTQGLEPEQTNLHGMAGRGQMANEAIEATKRSIDDPCTSLATRIHAAQDLATPGHAGQPWTGFHFDLETARHIMGDLFPSPSTYEQAYSNTIYVLTGQGTLDVPGVSNGGW